MLKAFKKEKVYTVKYILNNLNEFALLSVIYIQSESKIALLKACKNLQIQISEFIIDTFNKNV